MSLATSLNGCVGVDFSEGLSILGSVRMGKLCTVVLEGGKMSVVVMRVMYFFCFGWALSVSIHVVVVLLGTLTSQMPRWSLGGLAVSIKI